MSVIFGEIRDRSILGWGRVGGCRPRDRVGYGRVAVSRLSAVDARDLASRGPREYFLSSCVTLASGLRSPCCSRLPAAP